MRSVRFQRSRSLVNSFTDAYPHNTEDSLEAVRNAVKLQSVNGDGERGQSYRVNETLSSSLLRLKVRFSIVPASSPLFMPAVSHEATTLATYQDRIALFNPKAETDGPSAAGPAMDSSGECSKGTAAQGNSDNIQSTKKKVSVVLPTVEPEPSSVDARISEILASVGEAVWLEGEKEAQREGERLSPAVEILRNEFSWAEGNEDGQAGKKKRSHATMCLGHYPDVLCSLCAPLRHNRTRRRGSSKPTCVAQLCGGSKYCTQIPGCTRAR